MDNRLGGPGPEINPGTVWTIEQCEDALDHHVDYFLQGLLKFSPKRQTALPRRIAAVTSWAYNCPSVLGLEASRELARALHLEAVGALEPFGAAAEPLRWLSHHIVTRGS